MTESPSHHTLTRVGRQSQRLSLCTLDGLPAAVHRPAFDPAQLTAGILHLGCGAFHRAHQAFLTQRAIEAEVSSGAPLPAWGIVGVGLRTPRTTQLLAPQQNLYTVLERAADRTTATVVGTLRETMYAPESPGRLARAFTDPNVRVVTLTVTVPGYCVDPATGGLDVTDPAVAADLRLTHPRTAVGVLVHGLRARRAAGLPPPVVLSCDNLPANGRVLRTVCRDFAALQDDALARWIETEVQFPATMVDRIVPRGTLADVNDATATLGVVDAAPVSAEPFHQWVIEHFDGPRPRWDAAGVEYVADVGPWEASKLRLLNGGHLAVAFLGRLAGCQTVAEAMALPGMAAYALQFMLAEQRPTLPPSNHDIAAYGRQLLARWRNPAVAHQLERIVLDASAKLPVRLLAPLAENLRAGRPTPCARLALAAWMRCQLGRDERGRPLSLPDGLAVPLGERALGSGGDPERLVASLLAQPGLFDELQHDNALRAALVHDVARLGRLGVRAVLADTGRPASTAHGMLAVPVA